MRVGLVVYGGLDETSGGFRYDRKLVEHLRDRGDEVDVIALPWRSYPRHLGDGLSRSLRRRLDRPFDVLLQDELCHPSLWRHNPRLDEPRAVVSLVHLLRSAGPASRGDPLYRRVEARYLRTVDAAIATSEHTRDRTTDLADLPTTTVRPAGRAEAAAIERDRAVERARDGPLRVLFVGSLVPRKGPLTLLTALERLDADCEATLVGREDADPAHARRVWTRAAELPSAEVLGEVDDDRLADLFESAHVLAVPSRYEGFGMVYLEAMERGVVPIASTAGGADEVVADGESGLLVDPDDPEALGRSLARLATDRDRLADLACGALEAADAHPTWDEQMGSIREFLASVVDARDAPAGDVSPAVGGRDRRPAGGESA